MTRYLFSILSLVLVGLVPVDAMAQQRRPAPGYASAERNLRLRARPSPSSRVVSSVPQGYPVHLGFCEGGWCEVEYLGVRGYTLERHLDFSDRPPARSGRHSPPRPGAGSADRPGAHSANAPERAPIEPAAARLPVLLTFRGTAAPGGVSASAQELASLLALVSASTLSAGASEREVPVEARVGLAAIPDVPVQTRPPLLLFAMPRSAADVLASRLPAADPEDRAAPLASAAAAEAPEPPPPLQSTGAPQRLDPAPVAVLPPPPRPCPPLVEQAATRLSEGDPEGAIDLLSHCLLKGRPKTTEAAQVHRLLALAHFKANHTAAAERALIRLLALDPEYEPRRPHGPPQFAALVSDIKRELGLPAPYQCDLELAYVQDLYVGGFFDEAILAAERCLDKSHLVADEAVRAYRFVALAHLRRSDLAAARLAVTSILDWQPSYRADPVSDVPDYVALVELVRRQVEVSTEGAPPAQ